MTEPAGSAGQASPADGGQTAGAILRAAREGRGLHIAALAASIKVSPRKLDALEGDRLDELPDATFARALAQAVCRALKVDPQPVLAKMPAAESAASSLERHRAGLNAPFEEVSGRSATAIRSSHKAMLAAGLLLVVSAAGILLLPPGFLRREQPLPSSISAPQASQSAPAGSGAAPAPALPVAFAPSAAVAASAGLASLAAPLTLS